MHSEGGRQFASHSLRQLINDYRLVLSMCWSYSWWDFAAMRLVDFQLTLPTLPLVLVVAFYVGPSRGMLIAMLLLVLFLGIATYWVYRSAEKIVDQKKEQAAPAPAAPAPAAPARAAPLHQSSLPTSQSLP